MKSSHSKWEGWRVRGRESLPIMPTAIRNFSSISFDAEILTSEVSLLTIVALQLFIIPKAGIYSAKKVGKENNMHTIVGIRAEQSVSQWTCGAK